MMMGELLRSRESEAPLLVKAELLGQAKSLSRRRVEGLQLVHGALLLDADPVWTGATNTILVKEGMTISELRRAAGALGSRAPKDLDD
jgi:hypothetical protein